MVILDSGRERKCTGGIGFVSRKWFVQIRFAPVVDFQQNPQGVYNIITASDDDGAEDAELEVDPPFNSNIWKLRMVLNLKLGAE